MNYLVSFKNYLHNVCVSQQENGWDTFDPCLHEQSFQIISELRHAILVVELQPEQFTVTDVTGQVNYGGFTCPIKPHLQHM